jgi:hypothetical protein
MSASVLAYKTLTFKLQKVYIKLKSQKYLPCIIQLQNKLRVVPEGDFIMENMKQVENIRKQYEAKTEKENKLDKLRALDAKVKRPADIFAYSFGTVGALVLGVGMCITMSVLSAPMALGVVVGIVGIAAVAANCFIYKAILKNRKKKYAAEILQLSDEILNK